MRIVRIILVTLVVTLGGGIANAQSDYVWIGGTSNSWNDPSNWDVGGGTPPTPPQTGDNIFFNSSALNNCVLDVDDLDGNADPSENVFGTFNVESTFGQSISFDGAYNLTVSSLTVAGGAFDFSLAGTLTVSGALTVSGGDINLSDAQGVHSFGSITVNGGNFNGGNVTQILINGALTISSGSFVSTSGELTIENGGTTIISRTGGTFDANSGLVSVTLASNSTSTITTGLTFNNLTITNPSASVSRAISLGSGTTTVSGTLAIGAVGTRTVSITGNGTINVLGDVDVSNHTGSGSPSHSCTIAFVASSGTSNLIGSSAIGTGRLPNITINQSGSASLIISDFVNLVGNWNYASNTPVTTTSSTVTIYGTRNLDATASSQTMAFNDLNIGRTGNTASVTLTGALQVNGTLTINGSSTLNTGASNFALTLGGNFSNIGTFTPNSSVITLTGTSSQSLDFRNATTPTIHTLICSKTSGTATITDAINISSILQCTSGTLALGSGLVTLLSTSATASAQVASSSGTISGTANIQRFIPSNATRRWRFLAAPITAASGLSIRNGWQSQMFITGPGTGTGPVGSANYNSNGYDWTLANSPSLYTYNETLSGGLNSRWVAPATTTGVNLSAGTGYRVFIRGDRSNTGVLDGSVSTQASVTLSVTGSIPTGNVTVGVSCSNGCGSDDGWNLVGNPYPATIDWNLFQPTNNSIIHTTYYSFNPTLNTYVAWNGSTGDAGRYISSGQAFWVRKLSGGSSNLTFQESHKSTGQTGGALFKTSSLTNHLAIKLIGTSFMNSCFIHLNTTGQYGQDNYDAIKLGYGTQQIATFTPTLSTRMDINNLPLFGAKTTDTVEVEVNVPAASANYQLNFNDVNSFSDGLKVYLQDKHLNTLQDLSVANTYSFATNGTAASTGNRFRILITNQNTPLPVVFTALEAQLTQNGTTDLTWSTLTEKNNTRFVVERSTDLINYIELGVVKAVGNANTKNTYRFTDVQPGLRTTNYYRVKQIDLDGKFTYTNIAAITTDGVEGGQVPTSINTKLTVYPVPTQNELTLAGLDGSSAVYTIVDVLGNEISTGTLEINDANEAMIQVSELPNGIYIVAVKTDSGLSAKAKFIVE